MVMMVDVVFLELMMEGGLLLFSVGFSCLLKMGLCVCSIVSCKCKSVCSGNGCIVKM